MKFKTQAVVLKGMERETRVRGRAQEDYFVRSISGLWMMTNKRLVASVMSEYRQDFGRARWDFASAKYRGTLARMGAHSKVILQDFSRHAETTMSRALNEIYSHEALRQLWMLDSLTPPSYKPVKPQFRTHLKKREAASPRDYRAIWKDVVDAWLETYELNLGSDLRKAALDEGDIHDVGDAAAEVEISGTDPNLKWTGLMSSQALMAQDDARDDVAAANTDLISEEIWMTMEDARVCPICEPYAGQPLDSIDDEIPAHFNCRCYTRIVPKVWADMLANGSPDEIEAALQMDDLGMVPSEMAIRAGSVGELIGNAIVSFEDWLSGPTGAFYGQNLAGFSGSSAIVH